MIDDGRTETVGGGARIGDGGCRRLADDWRALRAQTAWESYKNRKYPASVDKHLTDPALIGAIDLHAHSDPDSYPRSWDGFEVAKLAQERGMRGVVLKNHWTETAGLAYLARRYATPGFEVFGAVSLDTPVGGVNPQAVRYMADVVGHFGRIVWMPTTTPSPKSETKSGTANRAARPLSCRAADRSFPRCSKHSR